MPLASQNTFAHTYVYTVSESVIALKPVKNFPLATCFSLPSYY